jgi:hypothetical protein
VITDPPNGFNWPKKSSMLSPSMAVGVFWLVWAQVVRVRFLMVSAISTYNDTMMEASV